MASIIWWGSLLGLERQGGGKELRAIQGRIYFGRRQSYGCIHPGILSVSNIEHLGRTFYLARGGISRYTRIYLEDFVLSGSSYMEVDQLQKDYLE